MEAAAALDSNRRHAVRTGDVVVARQAAFQTRWWLACRCSGGLLYFFLLFAVRARVRCTTKVSLFAVRPVPGARQSLLDAVSLAVSLVFFTVLHVTHNKACSPCVIREGARQ
jgi:hypothetical protein